MRDVPKPSLTDRIRLPGGQERLRQMILYVSARCEGCQRFGSVKLNKILWKADFDAFAARGVPVTGRLYQRLELGPAPKEMVPVRREMREKGLIRIDTVDFGDGIREDRTVALVPYDLTLFTNDDIAYVENAISYYWSKTGRETSDDSHGMAWKTHNNGDALSYELAYLSDEPLSEKGRRRLTKKAQDMGWVSQ